MKITIDFKGSSGELKPSIKIGENDTNYNDLNSPTVTSKQEKVTENTKSMHNSTKNTNRDKITTGVIKERLMSKSVETFVWKEKLFVKIGDFYGWLNVDNDFTPVVSSCYYYNRKKANTHVV